MIREKHDGKFLDVGGVGVEAAGVEESKVLQCVSGGEGLVRILKEEDVSVVMFSNCHDCGKVKLVLDVPGYELRSGNKR